MYCCLDCMMDDVMIIMIISDKAEGDLCLRHLYCEHCSVSLYLTPAEISIFFVWLQARRGLIIVHCEWVPGTASCSLPEAARCLCGANTHSQNAGGQEREARMGGEISTSVSVFYCHACLFVCGCNPNIVLDSYTLGLRRHPVDNQDWAARSGKTELPNFDSVGLLNDV